MRIPALALLVLLAGALLASAQQPAAPQTPQPTAAQIDAVLGQWERAMTDIKTLVAQLSRTKVNKVFGTTEKYEGSAKFLKPNKASLELRNTTNPQVFEKIICNGNHLFLYAPDAKEIRAHKLPDPKPGQVVDDNFLSFLFGMKAAEAKQRYQLNLLPPPPNDKWYYYVEVLPRNPVDKAEFTRARLVLNISNGLPRQLWFEEPNGNHVTWDFNQMQTGANVGPQEFAQPTPPAGWQMRVMQDPQPARVIRP